MKVPRLGLQVNYTQDSSRHNDNAETLEAKIILCQFLYSTINTNPTNKLVDFNTHSEEVCSCDEGTKIRPASELHPGFIKAQRQRRNT